MSNTLIYLAEITAVIDAAGTLAVLRYASQGYNTGPLDAPPDTHYAPRISQPALMRRDMFSGGQTSGRTAVGYGEMRLVNNDGALDALLGYGFAGQPLVIKLGDPLAAYGTFATVFSGTMEQADFDLKTVTIRLKDKLLAFDLPLASAQYGGTNVLPAGMDGVDDLKGKPKPLVFGRVFNAEPVLVNSTKLIYQLSSAVLSAVDAVYDRGAMFTPGVSRPPGVVDAASNQVNFTVNTTTDICSATTGFATGMPVQVFSTTTLPAPLAASTYYFFRAVTSATFTMHPTLADANTNTNIVNLTTTGTGTHSINNLTIPGRFDYCLDASGSYVRLGATPTGQVTFDASAGAAAADRTAAQILRAMALAMGTAPGSISDADIAALDAVNAAEVGIYITDTGTTLAAMDEIAASIGAWYGFDALGTLRMGRFDVPAGLPVARFGVSTITGLARITPRDEANGLPAWRVRLGYQKINTVQTTDLAASVTADRRGVLALAYRTASAEDATVKVQYATSPAIERDTLLTARADADLEAARLLALRKVRRDTYEVSVRAEPADLMALDLGRVVSLTHPRFGLAGGKAWLVLGLQTDLQTNSAKLTLWG